MISFSELTTITKGKIVLLSEDRPIQSLITDSRKTMGGGGSLFFAISGRHHDGHIYIQQLYDAGIRQFVVEKSMGFYDKLNGANIFLAESALTVLQDLAAHYRSQMHARVIAITGSNGKTIVKEWLYQLLSDDFNVVKNPGSYNSQLGVPLSVWQMQSSHNLAIFEAGISTVGEMARLEKIIRPQIGVFTNIGTAHDEGFQDQKQKTEEKAKLFANSDVVIHCNDHQQIRDVLASTKTTTFTWAFNNPADIRVSRQGAEITVSSKAQTFSITLPFSDNASVENALHCIATLLYFKYESAVIVQKISQLKSVAMRLELKEAVNNCQLIDDTYNNDLAGLQISLQFLKNQQQKKKKTVILSDILQSGLEDQQLIARVKKLITENHVHRFIGIGPKLQSQSALFPAGSEFYPTTDSFIQNLNLDRFHDEIVLVKGARVFQFEKIVHALQRKVHGTIIEVDLGAVVHNLNYFRSLLKPTTKIMVMVKAFAYGSGSVEIANVLQYHRVDYLGVAYADEGIELRKNNITIPIMVMNPSEESFDALLAHHLEPEMYSFRIFNSFLRFLDGRKASIHLKLDTGMHRLGFEETDIEALIGLLKIHSNLRVASIFSHLAGADEEEHDNFSLDQGARFQKMADRISAALGYKPIYHIINSPGILRLPELQLDMVRLGIGLYGVDPTSENKSNLQVVATLKTVVSQVKHIPKGETVGYGRRGKATTDITTGTIAIGYADGFSRAFSRGVGEVLINGHRAKVIGNVCMDMTMVDLTGIPAKEGDEVIIFGKDLPIHDVAQKINTIPYEILTNTSERVKRVFVAESI
jgi:Alr-MurF fusion protein